MLETLLGVTKKYKALMVESEEFPDLKNTKIPAAKKLNQEDKNNPRNSNYSDHSVYAVWHLINELDHLADSNLLTLIGRLIALFVTEPNNVTRSLDYLHQDMFPQVIDERTEKLANLYMGFLPQALDAMAEDLSLLSKTPGLETQIDKKLHLASVSLTKLKPFLSNITKEQQRILDEIDRSLQQNIGSLKGLRKFLNQKGFEIPVELNDYDALLYAKEIYLLESNKQFRQENPDLFIPEITEILDQISSLKETLVRSLTFKQKIDFMVSKAKVKNLEPILKKTRDALNAYELEKDEKVLLDNTEMRNRIYEETANKLRQQFSELNVVKTLDADRTKNANAVKVLHNPKSTEEEINAVLKELNEMLARLNQYSFSSHNNNFDPVMDHTRNLEGFQTQLDYYQAETNVPEEGKIPRIIELVATKSDPRKQIERQEHKFRNELHFEFRKKRQECSEEIQKLQKEIPQTILALEQRLELLNIEKFVPNATLSFTVGNPLAVINKVAERIETLRAWIEERHKALSDEFDTRNQALQVDLELINTAKRSLESGAAIGRLPATIPVTIQDKLLSRDTDQEIKLRILTAFEIKLTDAQAQLAQQHEAKKTELKPHEIILAETMRKQELEASLASRKTFEVQMKAQSIEILRLQKSIPKQEKALELYQRETEARKRELEEQQAKRKLDFSLQKVADSVNIAQIKTTILNQINTYQEQTLSPSIDLLKIKQSLLENVKKKYIPKTMLDNFDDFAKYMDWDIENRTKWKNTIEEHSTIISRLRAKTTPEQQIAQKLELNSLITTRLSELKKQAEASTEEQSAMLMENIHGLVQLRADLVDQEKGLDKLTRAYDEVTEENKAAIDQHEKTSTLTMKQMKAQLDQDKAQLKTMVKQHLEHQLRYNLSIQPERLEEISKIESVNGELDIFTKAANSELQNIPIQTLEFKRDDSSETILSKITKIDDALSMLSNNQKTIEQFEQRIKQFERLGGDMNATTILDFNKLNEEHQKTLQELNQNKKALEFTLPRKLEEEKRKARKDTKEAVKILSETKTATAQEETHQAYETLNNLIQDIGKMSAIQFFQSYPNPNNEIFKKWLLEMMPNPMQTATNLFVAQQKKLALAPEASADLTTSATLAKYLTPIFTRLKNATINP